MANENYQVIDGNGVLQTFNADDIGGGVLSAKPTIRNGSGADAVNIQDGGNTITVDGTVGVSGSVAVTGPLTDTELRATPVPVSGTVTATGPLTDTQLRATPVPVSGTVTATGPLTDTQLRATPVPVSGTVAVTGVATEATLLQVETAVELIDDAILTDDTAFTPATTKVMMVGYQVDNTGTDSVDEGDAGAPRMSTNRVPFAQLRDAAGNERGANVNTSNALLVTQTGALPAGTNNIGDVDVLSIVPGTGATNLGKAVDGTAGATDTGVVALAVRTDSPSTISPPSGDYTQLRVDSMGRQHVVLKSGAATVSSVSGSATNAVILASNNSRTGATIYNDSSAVLYLKLGTTASTTSFTIKMQPDSYYEVPYGYTGDIHGIWASATGSARVTELT